MLLLYSASGSAAEELVFLVDSSNTVLADSNWQSVTSFIIAVINNFPISPNNVRIALIRYSDSAQIMFGLNSYSDRTAVTNAVSGVSYTGGGSNLAAALDLARNQVLNQARPGVPKVVCFITAQIPASSALTQAYSNAIAAGIDVRGVDIYGDVGSSVDSATFYQITRTSSGDYRAVWSAVYSQLRFYVSVLTRFVDLTSSTSTTPAAAATTTTSTTTPTTTTRTTPTTTITTTTTPMTSVLSQLRSCVLFVFAVIETNSSAHAEVKRYFS